MHTIFRLALLAILIAVCPATRGMAGGCCARCGCNQPCDKVCRLVYEEKKVKVICWGVQCEDFCLPGPSKPGCKHCEEVCTECDDKKEDKKDDKGPHGTPTKFVWRDWFPGACGKVYTKKKLMQKIVTKKVPGYKWVVEDLCPDCELKAESVKPKPGEKAPRRRHFRKKRSNSRRRRKVVFK